jgi:hypothetical protein
MNCKMNYNKENSIFLKMISLVGIIVFFILLSCDSTKKYEVIDIYDFSESGFYIIKLRKDAENEPLTVISNFPKSKSIVGKRIEINNKYEFEIELYDVNSLEEYYKDFRGDPSLYIDGKKVFVISEPIYKIKNLKGLQVVSH